MLKEMLYLQHFLLLMLKAINHGLARLVHMLKVVTILMKPIKYKVVDVYTLRMALMLKV